MAAIDRAPWNALVDDDGSNLVGTIWNKDKIKTVILDPTDVAIAPAWVLIPHNAANFSASAGTWTVSAANQGTFRYVVMGRVAFFKLSLSGTSTSASASRLIFTLPAGVPPPTSGIETTFSYLSGGTTGTGNTEIGSTTINFLRDMAGTPWPIAAANLFLRAEFFYQIA